MTKSVVGEKDRVSSLRNLFSLGFVSLFTDMSSEMVFSLLPTFVLGLPGSSRAILGLIEGTAETLSYALRAVSGVSKGGTDLRGEAASGFCGAIDGSFLAAALPGIRYYPCGALCSW